MAQLDPPGSSPWSPNPTQAPSPHPDRDGPPRVDSVSPTGREARRACVGQGSSFVQVPAQWYRSLEPEAPTLDNGTFPRPRRPSTLSLARASSSEEPPIPSSEAWLRRAGGGGGLHSDPRTGGPPGAALAQGSAAHPRLSLRPGSGEQLGQGSALPLAPAALAPGPLGPLRKPTWRFLTGRKSPHPR